MFVYGGVHICRHTATCPRLELQADQELKFLLFAQRHGSASRDCDRVCQNTAVVNSPTAAVGRSRRMRGRQRWPTCAVLGKARRSGKGEVTANVSGATR